MSNKKIDTNHWTKYDKIRRILARYGGSYAVRLLWKIGGHTQSRVRAIIVDSTGEKVLLVKNITYKEFHLPGGGIEDNEDPEIALHRELEEELKVKVTILYKLNTYPTPDKKHTIHIYVTQAESEEITMQWELDDAQWFYLHSLPALRPTAQKSFEDFSMQHKKTSKRH